MSTTPPASSPAELRNDAEQSPQPPEAAATPKKNASSKKAKADPQNLEQFIEYAYARKGQRLTLKSKVEKQIAQNARLDDAAVSRLLQLAATDTLLAVPRQILLVSQEAPWLLSLKATLTSFVSTVMLRHPAFSDAGVAAAVRNLPEALPAADALSKVVAFEPPPSNETNPLKSADVQELRRNAVQLFVTWLAISRGLNAEKLSSLLFQVVWQPAAKELIAESARVRALTEIEHGVGVGLACQLFHQQAVQAKAQLEQLERQMEGLSERLIEAETQLEQKAAQLAALQTELQSSRARAAADTEALRRQQAVDKTHLQHALEQLRGRLVKRLSDSVDMLEVGLSALRKDTPRIPVMAERAESVIDSLKAEIHELKEE